MKPKKTPKPLGGVFDTTIPIENVVNYCIFCGAVEEVTEKGICRPCLKICASCAVANDLSACLRNPQTTCGNILANQCWNCGGKKTRYKYCDACVPIMERKQKLEASYRFYHKIPKIPLKFRVNSAIKS